MPEKNVQIIRRLVATYNESGFGAQATLAFFAESAVFEEPPEQPGLLLITVNYRVRSTNTRYNFVYPFYKNEGTEIRNPSGESSLTSFIR